MKKIHINTYLRVTGIFFALWLFTACDPDESDLQPATYSNNPNVFIDTFSGGLEYYAFGDSDVSAFNVVTDVKYSGTSSMQFAVPTVGSADGSYAGGVFVDPTGRDLTGYNVLTFYMKASIPTTIDLLGIGNYFGDNEYEASITNVVASTNWQKYYIPLPDAAKLTSEKGLFYYADAAADLMAGYTFWIDEVKFENLGTLNNWRGQIFNGQDINQDGFIGNELTISGISCLVNLPTTFDQQMNVSPAYFDYTSSNPNVATVDANGNVVMIGNGTTVITASLNGQPALGSLTLNVLGEYTHAPTPTQNAADVISIFSDAYNNVPVDYYNGYWEPYQTTTSSDFEVNGDHVLSYQNFNFVGNSFANPTIDATLMSHIHFDFYFPNAISPATTFKITVRDYGADGADGGGDDTNLTTTFNSSDFTSGSWNSIDIPLNMANKTKLGLIIYEGTNVSNFYLDNIYMYNDGSNIPLIPTVAAPAPTQNAADVISIFSDAYTDVAGTNFNPGWGQATAVSFPLIAGNETYLMTGLNYQGIQLGSNLDVSGKSFLHLDYYTADSSTLNVYLISPGPVENSYSLTVPSSANWSSVDIPLSNFSPVNLANIFQFKFDGNGTVYVDNLYFY